MGGWRLESLDQDEVPSVLNPASDTVVADVQELSPTVQTLHWVAPSSYLGNKVSQVKWNRIALASIFISIVWCEGPLSRVRIILSGFSYGLTVPAADAHSHPLPFLRFHHTVASSPTSPNHLGFPGRA